ncbi:MAG: sigma-70 family RNA polymerase sigma factor [Bryobacterales bacterium]|nr:sigma-70 family RNA polymerase sigma factor [Bryobacterales bacterium]
MSATAATRPGIWQERDHQLRAYLERMGRGESEAFALLYDATSTRVYSLVLRVLGNPADAEEVSLDVYMQAWRDAKRFDATRGSVGAWLMTIARSRALDRLRSHESRQKRETAPVDYDRPSDAPTPEELSSMSEDRRAVAEAMASLVPEHRVVIELAYFRGMSHSEMAAHLELPLGTVKTRVRLGMMRLRELIEGDRG